MITASSFHAYRPKQGPSALLFPSFVWMPTVTSKPTPDHNEVELFLQDHVLSAHKDRYIHTTTAKAQKELSRDKAHLLTLPMHDIVILICGHSARDSRCGIMGKLLQSEFEAKLRTGIFDMIPGPDNERLDGWLKSSDETAYVDNAEILRGWNIPRTRTMVGLISHVGGHKFAGNVIIYIPPVLPNHPLAGKGIWYGRVEPKHVEGIVEKTIYQGHVIEELFRGGIGQNSEMLRI